MFIIISLALHYVWCVRDNWLQSSINISFFPNDCLYQRASCIPFRSWISIRLFFRSAICFHAFRMVFVRTVSPAVVSDWRMQLTTLFIQSNYIQKIGGGGISQYMHSIYYLKNIKYVYLHFILYYCVQK